MPMLVPTTGKPRVILGCMTFGPDKDAGARITSLDTYKSCLDHLQAAGYNEIDTARIYVGGKQEAWTRDAGYQSRGLSLATKWYPHYDGAHEPAKVREALETSLKELDTKCVDIFYLHAADRTVPFEKTLEECNKLHKEGKFVQLGLSNFTAFEVAEVAMLCRERKWVQPTIYQGMYNAICRSLETETIVACRRYGLDVVVYNPLAGGLFSGKYTAADLKDTPTEGRFGLGTWTGESYRKRYFHDATFEALSAIEPAVKAHGLTMLETALRWCVHHSALNVGGHSGKEGRDGVIIGVSSEMQLDSNLKDLEKGPLPKDVVEALDVAWRIAKMDTPVYWHKDLKYTYKW